MTGQAMGIMRHVPGISALYGTNPLASLQGHSSTMVARTSQFPMHFLEYLPGRWQCGSNWIISPQTTPIISGHLFLSSSTMECGHNYSLASMQQENLLPGSILKG